MYAVTCGYCGANGPVELSEAKAAESWNRCGDKTRAALMGLADTLGEIGPEWCHGCVIGGCPCSICAIGVAQETASKIRGVLGVEDGD